MRAGQEWLLLDERGNSALPLTSFAKIVVKDTGTVLSQPVEEGGFTTYNKVTKPLDLTVTLGFWGEALAIDAALKKLAELRAAAVKLTVVTPSAAYSSLTLENYNYTRSAASNADALEAELHLVEVREVKAQQTNNITSPKNPTSAGTTETGKKQAAGAENSLLAPKTKSIAN